MVIPIVGFLFFILFSGNTNRWVFNGVGNAYNSNNSSTWNVISDQRTKENIVKADLKTCYDNIKNTNLHKSNFTDVFDTGSQYKNKLGYKKYMVCVCVCVRVCVFEPVCV